MNTVVVRHNFETGHRLPHLGGKCTNLHGHSWWVEVTLTGDRDLESGTVAEFGRLKTALRTWVDLNLDHGLMLGHTDPLATILVGHGKVYVFGADRQCSPGEEFATDLPWPTVENVAVLLGRVAADLLVPAATRGRVVRVRVQETHVNAAEWVAE